MVSSHPPTKNYAALKASPITPDLSTRLQQRLLGVLPSFTTGLIFLFTTVGILDWLLYQKTFVPLFGAAVVVLAVRMWLATANIRPQWGSPILFGLSMLSLALLVNGTLAFPLPRQNLFFLLLLLSTGALFYSLRWLLCFHTIVLSSWVVVTHWLGVLSQWSHIGIALFTTSVLSILMMQSRVAMHTRFESLQAELHQKNTQLHDALALSESNLRRLTENARDIVFRIQFRPEPYLDYINAAVVNITGYTPAELYQNPGLIYDAIHPEDSTQLPVHPEKLTLAPLICRYYTRNGALIWLEKHLTLFQGEDGEVIGAEGIARDITKQKEFEQELQRAKEEAETVRRDLQTEVNRHLATDAALRLSQVRLQAALQAAETGLWDWDLTSGEIHWSDSLMHLFGLDPTTFVPTAQSFLSLIHPDDHQLIKDSIQEALTEHDYLYDVEYRLLGDDGTTRWHNAKGRVIRSPEGVPLQMMGCAFDVTEHKRSQAALQEAKEQAESASHLKNTILANMSHEIRTPMTAILGFSEFLEYRSQEPDVKRYAAIIHEGGTRLLHLLDNIIDLARIEADRLDLAPTPHRLADSVRHTTEMLQVLSQQKSLDLIVDVPDDLTVFTDTRREEQILVNVIGNAIRFTEQGSITVSAEYGHWGVPSREMALLKIQDTGCGIDPQFLPYVFEEFRQESEGRSRTHQGSGLGLPIAKRLVEKMEGALQINTAKGEGTTITIALPLASPGMDSCSVEALRPDKFQPVPQPEMRILVVEDDEHCAALLSDTLRPLYTVHLATTGEAALEAVQHHGFDLILMDIHLQGSRWDGIETLQEIRRIPTHPGVPAIALTAYAMKGDAEWILQQGFTAYVSKPFDTAELLIRIDALLGGGEVVTA